MASYFERALGYAQRVVSGAEVAGLLERLACERFMRDIERQGSAEFPFTLDEARGARACRFIELLPHIKGEWAKPQYVDGRFQFAKIRLEDWQVFIEFQLFGWIDAATGLRRFRRSYEEIARKNAKSTRAAARELFMLTADGEPGAHCYSAATTGEQAREVFDVARNMALREPEFCARFGVTVGKHDITIAETASSFKPLNAEGSTLDGLNIHSGVVDEVHAHKTRAVWDVLDTATGARSQPLLSAITTAGSDRSGICYELRDYTVKVLQGVIDDERWFGIIFTIDDGDVWSNPAIWRKANPNLDISVKREDMEAAAKRAAAQPSALNNFLTKRLNIWVNADSAWMDIRAWEACGDPTLRLEDFEGEECIASLDLASKVDIAAKARVFRRGEDFYGFMEYYLPERAVANATNSQYSGWQRQGLLTVTDGEVTDYSVIEEGVRDDMRRFQVREVPFDPFQATQLSGNLLAEDVPMVEMRPTVLNFSEPMKQLEALVLTKKFHHNGDPVLRWMVSNVVCHSDAKDNIYPRKNRVENKIDGVVALIMSLGRWMAAKPVETTPEIIIL